MGERCPPIFGNDGLGIGDTLGVWLESNPTTLGCDRTFLQGCPCVFGRFVSWRTGHSTQPYDGGLGNSLRRPPGSGAIVSRCGKLEASVDRGLPLRLDQECLSWLWNWSEENAQET